MSDIRLYKYEGAILRKVTTTKLKHKYKSVEDCINAIDNYQLGKHFSLPSLEVQYVIVEYTGEYRAKIVQIYNKTHIKS